LSELFALAGSIAVVDAWGVLISAALISLATVIPIAMASNKSKKARSRAEDDIWLI
jgi:hypothetical protein